MTVFFITPQGELTGTATPVEFTLDRAAINISIEWEPLDGPATQWDTVWGDTDPDFTGGRFAYRYSDSTNVGNIWSIKPPDGDVWKGRFRIMVDEAPAGGGGGDMPPGLVAKWTVTNASSPEITPVPVIDTASGLAINATYPALLNGLKAPADTGHDYGIDVANLGTVSTYFNPGQTVAAGMAPFATSSNTAEELKPGQKGYLVFTGSAWQWVPDAIAAPQPTFRTNTCISFISSADANTDGYQFPSPNLYDCTHFALEVWGANYGLKGLPIPDGSPWDSGIAVPVIATNVGGETLHVRHDADAGSVPGGYASIWNQTLADFDLAPGQSMVLIYNHQQSYDIGILNGYDPDVERWWAFPMAAGGSAGASTQAVYAGHTTGNVTQSSTTWADFIGSLGGGWVDELQDGVTRSGSTFTVTEDGYYQLYADLRTAQVSAAAYGNWRWRKGSTTILEHSAYSGDPASSAASPAGQHLGIVQLSAGDVITFQYCGNANSAISAGVTDSEARWTGKISIARLGANVVGASQAEINAAIAAAFAALDLAPCSIHTQAHGNWAWNATSWSGIFTAMTVGAPADTIAQNISRSGSTYTFAKAGTYYLSAKMRTYEGVNNTFIGVRARKNGSATVGQFTGYSSPSYTGVADSSLETVFTVNAGDTIAVEYVVTPSGHLSSSDPFQMDGEDMITANVSIVRLGGSVTIAPAPSSAGWITALDTNFTALSPQVLADGVMTIDGIPWTAENIASGADSVAVGSTGLVFTNNGVATARYYTSPSSAPLIKIKLSDLCPGWVPGQSKFRVLMQGQCNGNANHEVLRLSIDADPWTVGDQATWGWQHGAYDNVSPHNGVLITQGASNRGDVDITSVGTQNLFAIAIGDSILDHDFYSGLTTATDSPADDDVAMDWTKLKYRAAHRVGVSNNTQIYNTGADNPGTAFRASDASHLVLCIASAPNNTAHHLVSTIKRLRVEYKL